jgi:hypothetical protein
MCIWSYERFIWKQIFNIKKIEKNIHMYTRAFYVRMQVFKKK